MNDTNSHSTTGFCFVCNRNVGLHDRGEANQKENSPEKEPSLPESNTDSQPKASFSLQKVGWRIALAFLFCGCAQQHLNAPSGAGVTTGINKVGSSVSDARKYNDVAVIHNGNAMTRVQRIEAKSEVIKKYWQ